MSGLTKFNLSGLDAATHHFSDDNLIGRGTFADVYKVHSRGIVCSFVFVVGDFSLNICIQKGK
jgi:hypothetical protein